MLGNPRHLGGRYRGQFSFSRNYQAGDIVIDDDVLYIARDSVTGRDPSDTAGDSWELWSPTIDERTMSGAYVPASAFQDEAGVLDSLVGTHSIYDVPPTILDLNYATREALYGFETHTRSVTTGYTDMLGRAQTAAVDVAAFDRRTVGAWRLPVGLKIDTGTGVLIPSGVLLPTEYTFVVDAYFEGGARGRIASLNSGASTHRVEVGVNSNQQPYFVSQESGVVRVNQSLGPVSGWTSGFRRLVFSVKAGQCVVTDGVNSAVYNVSIPSAANLTRLDIGGSGVEAWVSRVRILGGALALDQAIKLAAGPAPLALWGDSLTAGTGSTGNGAWRQVVAASRAPITSVYNGGIGGETSSQVRTRMLADTMRFPWTSVIWVGRNNITQGDIVIADIKAMVDALGHRRFLIPTILNNVDGSENPGSLAYSQIMAINQRILTLWPKNSIDIRSMMVAASGGADDHVNPSWIADVIHPNNTGHAYIAQQFGQWLRSRKMI